MGPCAAKLTWSYAAIYLLTAALLVLAGCEHRVIERPSICPPVITYDRPFQARLADENDKLPDGSALRQALIDYGKLRSALRACRGG